MPDEATLAPSAEVSSEASAADTPNTAPVTDGQGTPTEPPDDVINMRADYTRKTQELAEQRREFEAKQAENDSFRELVTTALVNQDEEAAQQLLEQLGYEFEEEVGDDVDPRISELQKQVDSFNEWKEAQEAEADSRENAFHIEREFNRLELGSWDDQNPQHNAILALAFNYDDGQSPLNVQAGFDDYQKLRDWIIEDLKQSKLTTSNDSFGSPASAAPNANASLEERANLAIERNF